MQRKRIFHIHKIVLIAAIALFVFLSVYSVKIIAQPASSKAQSSPSATNSFPELARKALVARDSGRLDEAVPLLKQALTINPRWAEGWWSLGTIDYDNDRYSSAANAFRKVVTLNPQHGTARAMLGLCEFELGQDASALQYIEASKSLGIVEDPQLRQVVLYHEGLLLQRSGRFEGAQKALSSLCLSGVGSEELTLTFGMTVLHIREVKPPAPGTQQAEIVAHLGHGACLGAQKNYDAARQEYDFIASQYPHFPLLHYAYGKLLLEARDRTAAIHEFQQEIAEAPKSILPRLQIAAAEYKVDSAAGIPYADEAVRLDPQAPFSHYVLGLLLLDTGAYSQSIPHLEIARKAFPRESKIEWSLSVAYAHVGKPQQAAQARAAFARLNQSAGQESSNTSSTLTPDAGSQIEITDSAVTAGR